jgi:hypothetical protein
MRISLIACLERNPSLKSQHDPFAALLAGKDPGTGFESLWDEWLVQWQLLDYLISGHPSLEWKITQQARGQALLEKLDI